MVKFSASHISELPKQLFLKCGMYECRATKFFNSSIVSNILSFTLEDRSSILLQALTKAHTKTGTSTLQAVFRGAVLLLLVRYS